MEMRTEAVGDSNSIGMFSIMKSTSSIGPRLGLLRVPGREVLETPHYLGITSRGVIPHLAPDTFARDTSINATYVPLEDFIERYPHGIPPVYSFQPPNGSSPLRRFIALPGQTLLVLGARRTPAIVSPAANSNTNSSISICTSVGFRQLEAEDYADAVGKLRPDIVVGLGDIPYGRALGAKRIEKATDRNIEWLQNHVAVRKEAEIPTDPQSLLFAPLLPVACSNQQYYIDALIEGLVHDLHGLVFYNLATKEDLPDGLQHFPRLAFTEPATPHEILQHIALGMDVLTVPFVTAATDAGIALDFSFPPETSRINGETSAPRALAVDMWSSEHSTSLEPIVPGCECYACVDHHRAYIQHLLNAKEMLAWVLLQIHNHHILDLFFLGIRQSIRDDTFEQDVQQFAKIYELQLPDKTGQGPRVRGYQFKSEGPGETKKNAASFQMLDDGKQKLAESILPPVDAGGDVLQAQGFAQKDA